ncbi:type II toxin-antitoxin system RelE/ParE family toxin [Psychrobacter jeotgali]|uniref:type II toxin-antitoxin system RelE/ParE family toxin n=1 Tax=Psychrobacter jeotgali TaxID=179010 RepID=UPI001917D76A|nr:type II toxin-antitoxin system YafQ family toxin [Psychrobacter jeotgali]
MRKVRRTRSFDKDFKKAELSENLIEVLYCMVKSEPLPPKYRDHALTGNLKSYRDCHVKPDLVLIYRIEDDVVELVRLNSHSEVFR